MPNEKKIQLGNIITNLACSMLNSSLDIVRRSDIDSMLPFLVVHMYLEEGLASVS